MRILFTAIIIATLFIPTARAGEHKPGANYQCFYDSNPGSGKWHYYFCDYGGSGTKCSGKRAGDGGGDEIKKLKHLETFKFATFPFESYCCCVTSDQNKFVKATAHGCYTDSYEDAEQIVKDLGNGQTCIKRIRRTVCGTDEIIDCNASDETCRPDRYRNGACAPICIGENMAYESQTSNTCISCPATAYQGPIKEQDGVYYCKTCDAATEFYDPSTKACVSKSGMTAISTQTMEKCWRCPTDADRKACMLATHSGTEPADNIRTNCYLK